MIDRRMNEDSNEINILSLGDFRGDLGAYWEHVRSRSVNGGIEIL
jgi:hypothetical protein